MKNTFSKAGLSCLTMAGLLWLGGCNKQIQDNTVSKEMEQNILVAEDDLEADVSFNEIGDQAIGVEGELGLGMIDLFSGADNTEKGADNDDYGKEISTDNLNPNRCFTVTVTPKDPLIFPKTMVVDYGTGCKGKDGKTRKGKMITVFSKPMMVPGAQAVTEFSGFFVDSVKVEGRYVTRNNSTSALTIITRIVQNGKLTKPNGNYIKWTSENHQTQIAGLGTPGFPRDDEWKITGAANGENLRGSILNTWSRQITEPLHKAFVCRWIDKGIVKITRNTQVSELNFGNGTCDNKATFTKDGTVKEITLR